MATPTVFVSSTFYDLRYARESLKRFIDQLGYTPILSEDGTVFYDPKLTAAESCLREVSNANLLVLLIGGRYGMEMPDSGLSVTNSEYQQAVADKVPIFALVEHGTHNDYLVYRANLHAPEVLEKMIFPNADSVRIFEFIDEVRTRTENNALVPFRTISDIEQYLRSQWAGMLHEYVTAGTKQAQVVDTLEMLQRVNERVELIASQILRSVGTQTDRVYISLMQTFMASSTADDLRYFGNPTPVTILRHETVQECTLALGHPIKPYHDPDQNEKANIITSGGEVTKPKLRTMERSYAKLRSALQEILHQSGLSLDEISEYEAGLSFKPIADAGPSLDLPEEGDQDLTGDADSARVKPADGKNLTHRRARGAGAA